MEPNCNYEVTCVPGKLTISKAKLSVSATGYSGAYDGAAHGISVTSSPESAAAKVYYSAERELTAENYQVGGSLINPIFTNTGTYRVYYCVAGNDYETVTGYMVSYADNVNAGTATATITGINNYKGTASAMFAIAQDNTPEPEPVALQPMYRLYNPYSGEHFYTASAAERDNLMDFGWQDEGVAWYGAESAEAKRSDLEAASL